MAKGEGLVLVQSIANEDITSVCRFPAYKVDEGDIVAVEFKGDVFYGKAVAVLNYVNEDTMEFMHKALNRREFNRVLWTGTMYELYKENDDDETV